MKKYDKKRAKNVRKFVSLVEEDEEDEESDNGEAEAAFETKTKYDNNHNNHNIIYHIIYLFTEQNDRSRMKREQRWYYHQFQQRKQGHQVTRKERLEPVVASDGTGSRSKGNKASYY